MKLNALQVYMQCNIVHWQREARWVTRSGLKSSPRGMEKTDSYYCSMLLKTVSEKRYSM
jgi:hypothetical protein